MSTTLHSEAPSFAAAPSGLRRADEVHAVRQDTRARFLAISQVSQWPVLVEMLRSEPKSPRPCWMFPLDACEAVGASRRRAWPTAAVIYGLLQSIHLVDDLLDEDPHGIHHRIGVGPAANAAVALQSAATMLLESCSLPAASEVAAHRALGRIALGTAYGQALDAEDHPGEEAYWRMVRLKTPPLFSYALRLGALVGGVSVDRAERIAALGGVLGELVQVSDDLRDALERPAAPDWRRQATNLPILYAKTAEHPQREEFLALQPSVDDLAALVRAQEILVRSGAVSYCAHRMIHAYRRARDEIEALALPQPAAMIDLFDHHVRPLRQLLTRLGVSIPTALRE